MQIIPIFPDNLDNTMRKELVKCETAAKYRFEWGLKAAGASRVDLVAGAAFAKGIETARKAFYQDKLNEYDALNQGIQALYAAYGDFHCPSDSNKSADRMAGALAFYLEHKPLASEALTPFELGGKLSVEISFDFPTEVRHPTTGKLIHYCGRFDMLAKDAAGKVWIVDEKTTKSLGDKWANQWHLDSQMTGYCWGSKKLLEKYGLGDLEIAGAVINGVSIKKYDYEHVRVQVYREDWEIARWFETMENDLEEWISAHQLNRHRLNLDHSCAYYLNPCDFAKLCKSRNPERLLDGNYVVERWNPLGENE